MGSDRESVHISELVCLPPPPLIVLPVLLEMEKKVDKGLPCFCFGLKETTCIVIVCNNLVRRRED